MRLLASTLGSAVHASAVQRSQAMRARMGARRLAPLLAAGITILLWASGRADSLPPPTPFRATEAPVSSPADALNWNALSMRSWMDGLSGGRDGRAVHIACLDANGDGRLNAGDGDDLSGVDVPLAAGACGSSSPYRDYFAGAHSDSIAHNCDAPLQPVLIVVIGGGGTNLLDASSGVSVGLLGIRNELYRRAAQAGIVSTTVLAAAAIAGADVPQTRMEQWLRLDVKRRLLATPCLRAVLIGHSHGGVAVTSVIAALEAEFTGRLYGAIVDRSTALYDRPAADMPHVAPLLNVFQLNEGWHGLPLNQPNIINIDESNEVAPKEPRVGQEPVVTVTHTNLDDSAGVQTLIVDRIMRWLDASRRR